MRQLCCMNVFYPGTLDIVLIVKADHKESAIMKGVLSVRIISKRLFLSTKKVMMGNDLQKTIRAFPLVIIKLHKKGWRDSHADEYNRMPTTIKNTITIYTS